MTVSREIKVVLIDTDGDQLTVEHEPRDPEAPFTFTTPSPSYCTTYPDLLAFRNALTELIADYDRGRGDGAAAVEVAPPGEVPC